MDPSTGLHEQKQCYHLLFKVLANPDLRENMSAGAIMSSLNNAMGSPYLGLNNSTAV